MRSEVLDAAATAGAQGPLPLETLLELAAAQAGEWRAITDPLPAHRRSAGYIPGQTIAGLVSVTSVLMVWTGLALAYRRLVAPFIARRPAAPRRVASF